VGTEAVSKQISNHNDANNIEEAAGLLISYMEEVKVYQRSCSKKNLDISNKIQAEKNNWENNNLQLFESLYKLGEHISPEVAVKLMKNSKAQGKGLAKKTLETISDSEHIDLCSNLLLEYKNNKFKNQYPKAVELLNSM
jgi:hypothetical protein